MIEKIQEAAANGRTVFSFEYFPPKTEEGVENLFERMDRMVAHGPNFCDITWGAGGSTADVTLDIANRMQNMVRTSPSPSLPLAAPARARSDLICSVSARLRPARCAGLDPARIYAQCEVLWFVPGYWEECSVLG